MGTQWRCSMTAAVLGQRTTPQYLSRWGIIGGCGTHAVGLHSPRNKIRRQQLAELIVPSSFHRQAAVMPPRPAKYQSKPSAGLGRCSQDVGRCVATPLGWRPAHPHPIDIWPACLHCSHAVLFKGAQQVLTAQGLSNQGNKCLLQLSCHQFKFSAR